MSKYTKEIASILASDAFCKIANSDTIKLIELNAALTLLVKANIDFDLQFASGTRREAAAIQLTIYITPTSTISFTVSLESGGSIFGGTNLG